MQSKAPIVSVLLPVYNAEAHLERSVQSIMCQSLHDWECVVVDDGSTDRSSDILASMARRDARIRPLHREHRGIVEALNAGLALCRGRYVARMDSDDLSHRDRLLLQGAFLDAHADVDVVSCLIRKFPRASLRVGMLRYEQWLNSIVTPEQVARDIFVESPLVHPSIMMRREVLQGLGGYRDHGWAEDYDLWIRVHLQGSRMAKVPRLLFYWLDQPDRLSRTSSTYSMENFRRCKVHYLRQGPLKDHREVVVWGAGRTGKRVALELLEQGLRVVAFVELDPRKIGMQIHGARAIHPRDLPPLRGCPVLVAVGKEGARELIRSDLRTMAFVEERDFWCLA